MADAAACAARYSDDVVAGIREAAEMAAKMVHRGIRSRLAGALVDPEDLRQEALLAALEIERAGKVDPDLNFRGYVYRAAFTRLCDFADRTMGTWSTTRSQRREMRRNKDHCRIDMRGWEPADTTAGFHGDTHLARANRASEGQGKRASGSTAVATAVIASELEDHILTSTVIDRVLASYPDGVARAAAEAIKYVIDSDRSRPIPPKHTRAAFAQLQRDCRAALD